MKKQMIVVLIASISALYSIERPASVDERELPRQEKQNEFRMLSFSERMKMQERRIEKEEMAEEKDEPVALSPVFSSHPGAFHYPIAVTLGGEFVELENGSLWSIKLKDSWKTLNWLVTDSIVIVPNRAWFSTYSYCLVNQNTGAVVQAGLELQPVYNGLYTNWVIYVDYYHNQVRLEDGSIWKTAMGDVDYWQNNDTVIIGINNGWLSNIHPNILINTNLNQYAEGVCIH